MSESMIMPRIVFRVDASLAIGTGHVMRCLTLAKELRERGAECWFICRPHEGHMLDLIERQSHRILVLPVSKPTFMSTDGGPAHAHWLGTDWADDAADTGLALGKEPVDWLIVDHYGLDIRWERVVRPLCKRLMVIDDLADRPHECELLLDQNLGRSEEHYLGLVPQQAVTLIGPQYALLRREFSQLRPASLKRRKHQQLKKMLITMGGVDKDNVTGQVLDALKGCPMPPDLQLTVVMGHRAPWLEQVQVQAVQLPCSTQVLAGVSNMAQLMVDTDLAIGAAGSTSWERCCLGVPAIQIVLAENQKEVAKALSALGAVETLDLGETLPRDLRDLMQTVQADPRLLHHLSDRASAICDGTGASAVADWIHKTSTLSKDAS